MPVELLTCRAARTRCVSRQVLRGARALARSIASDALARDALVASEVPRYLADMVQQKLARLASDFASQVFVALRAASLHELTELTGRAVPTSKPFATPKRVKTAKAAKAAKPAKPAKMAKMAKAANAAKAAKRGRAAKGKGSAPAVPVAATLRSDPRTTSAALDFFASRGSKGATAVQLGAHLAPSGLAVTSDIVDALVASGAIRDAGFRRAAGKNATAPVYVASAADDRVSSVSSPG